MARLTPSTNRRLRTLPHLAFKHGEVTHQLLHTAAGASRALLNRGVITAAARERPSLSARRDSERASRSSAMTVLKDGGPGLSLSAMALIAQRLGSVERQCGTRSGRSRIYKRDGACEDR